MTQRSRGQQKVSDELSVRLAQLGPGERASLIVVLATPRLPESAPDRSVRRSERAATVETLRSAMQPALAEVDRILASAGGRRLPGDLSALGAVPVETTAEGAHALAASDHVRALLEDQPIHGSLSTGT
ncbi:MAG: hypothetical protein U0893_09280 [Chloroflexota bacterium]